MKYGDIEKLHDAGLITGEQRRKIIEHFHFKEDGGGKFLAIVSIIGAVLITAGIALLISAHWNEIPRGVKIAAGIALMLGFHAGGWWVREVHGKYRKTGEALHLIGSGLFLANIALIGQIYNIVSRPPNAFLLWWIGIAALPWLLRSKAQHVLLMLAFGIWFGLEVNERGSLIYCESERQVLLYSLLGLAYLGSGYCLRATRVSGFAGVTEKFGLLAFLIFFPAHLEGLFRLGNRRNLTVGFSRAGRGCDIAGRVRDKGTSLTDGSMALDVVRRICGNVDYYGDHLVRFLAQRIDAGWRSTVGRVLDLSCRHAGAVCFLPAANPGRLARAFAVSGEPRRRVRCARHHRRLFQFVRFDGADGLMFFISGIFLIVFGVYLEKKRRKLMKQIKTQTTGAIP